jgi:hypothetical protein
MDYYASRLGIMGLGFCVIRARVWGSLGRLGTWNTFVMIMVVL